MKLIKNLLSSVLATLLALAPSGALAGTTNLDSLSLSGNLSVTGTTTQTGAITTTGNATVGGNLAVTGTTTQTGVATFTVAPVLTTATITASSDTYTIPDVGNASFVMTAGSQTIGGATTFTLAPVLTSGTISANGDTNTIPDLGNASFVMTEGTQTINGAKTFGTPLVAASINTGIKRQTISLNFKGGDVLTDGATYVLSIPMRRAGTVKAISLCAHTRMAGGTDTLALAKKQGGTSVTLLSTATVDPATVPTAADTAEALTLTATGGDLVFAAGDCLKATLVCGTMTTDGQGYALAIDVEYTDI